ncbi:hypothetical protein JWJ90_10535 [Desulfobulbus rhabdoformis]|nr:hypothetical protein [Desulfobulbus rhabdoformis]MBM9614722.1 hypothetical protein [Desulfobulbus rhabdoformis]
MTKKSKKRMTMKDVKRIEEATKKTHGGQIPEKSFARRARVAATNNDN